MKTRVADSKGAVKRFSKKYFDSVFPAAGNIQTVCLMMKYCQQLLSLKEHFEISLEIQTYSK